jgi:hypothetical protein
MAPSGLQGNNAHSTSASPWPSSASATVLSGSTATGSSATGPRQLGAPGDRCAADGALPASRGGSLPGVAEENAAEAALVDTLEVIGVTGLEGRHSHAPRRAALFHER